MQKASRHLRRALLGVRVVGLFTVVEIGLRTRPLPVLCRMLGLDLQSEAPADARGEKVHPDRALQMVRAVTAVSERWPFGDTCLRRCLVLGRLVREARPVLVVGVKRMEDQQIKAHAWLEVGGVSIDPLSASYAVLPL